jgi:hypothetical protein
MAATDPPDKQGRGKPQKRRYFRRRRRKASQEASPASEQGADGDDVQATPRARSKSQNRKRSENQRRSSRQRSSAARSPAKTAPHVAEESQPPSNVYIYTHVSRPTYRDGVGGEFNTEQQWAARHHHSLNLSGATASSLIGMDQLLESIGQQLDEWFGLSADSTTQNDRGEEANKPDSDSTDDGSPPVADPAMTDGRRADDDDVSPGSSAKD